MDVKVKASCLPSPPARRSEGVADPGCGLAQIVGTSLVSLSEESAVKFQFCKVAAQPALAPDAAALRGAGEAQIRSPDRRRMNCKPHPSKQQGVETSRSGGGGFGRSGERGGG